MKLLHAALLAFLALPAAQAGAQQTGYTAAELMADTGIDLVFDQFGSTIGESARLNGITSDAHFLATWERTATTSFDRDALNSALEVALTDAFTPEESAAIEAFYSSDFGERVVDLERVVLRMDGSGQAAAVAEGLTLYEALPDEDGRRAQIDELLDLAGAELTPELVRQSSRSLMMGMSLAQNGDIEIPWEEIDAQLEAQMPAIEAEIMSYQQALSAYTYRDLSDEELEQYLAFLRTDPARKFYGIFVPAVTRIVSAAMAQFGQKLGQNLTEEIT